MSKTETVTIKCVEVNQPIDIFYSGKLGWKQLFDIAYSDIRRIEDETDLYFGLQRRLSPNRLKQIAKYVSFSDATFPTSIVLSISTKDDEGNSLIESYKDGELVIKNKPNIAKIIDGQHRVFGLKKYIESNGLFADGFIFEFIVTIFLDMSPEDEAMVFSTINKAQTKVNKSLVYDLFSLSESRSPQRTCHNIVKFLNEEETPFKGKIKRLGTAVTNNETVTQATLVETILKYISKEPLVDRDKLIKGGKLDKVTGNDEKRLFFRNWFIQKEDSKILKMLLNYFDVISNKWNDAWYDDTKIISKSTGIIAFMRLLKDIVGHYGTDKIISENEFKVILDKVTLNNESFTNAEYASGGVGQSKLYNKLKEDTEV